MKTGIVKWFNPDKGYGFIVDDDSNSEIFVHASAIKDHGGKKELEEGQSVKYDTAQGQKGLQAINVAKIEFK